MKLSEDITDVLLAEDDEDDVMIFEMAVNSLPVKVKIRHAINGEMLFILLRQQLPDVIFLDINMPCKDGVACIAEIRKNNQ